MVKQLAQGWALVSGWVRICWGQYDSWVHTCNYDMHRRQCLISFMGRAFRYIRIGLLSLSHSSFFWAKHSGVFKCLTDDVDSVLRHLWVSFSLGSPWKVKNLAMGSVELWVWVLALSDSLQVTSAYHTSVSPPEKLVDKSSFIARGQTVLLFKFLSQEESWHSTSLIRETH